MNGSLKDGIGDDTVKFVKNIHITAYYITLHGHIYASKF